MSPFTGFHLDLHLRVTTLTQRCGWLAVVEYEIRVEGALDDHWSAWFEGLELASQPGGVTVIAGEVADQAMLHGLLAKVRDLGVPLISVHRVDPL
jgi:hypothetical protein